MSRDHHHQATTSDHAQPSVGTQSQATSTMSTTIQPVSRSGLFRAGQSVVKSPFRARPVRCFSTDSSNEVLRQLRQMAELRERVSTENSKVRKEAIIAEYPQLRNLLEHVYDPDFRTNLSFASLQKYLSTPESRKRGATVPQSIVGLLDKLSNRELTGNKAKEMVVSFLELYDVLPEGSGSESTKELETFGKLLDRNLVAGFGARTLSSVKWGSSSSSTLPEHAPEACAIIDSTSSKPSRKSMKTFPVALGKSIEPPFTDIAKSNVKWYASRKLDGVRVITVLDFKVDDSGIELVNVEFRSRSGKVFTSLDKVRQQLTRLERFPKLREWLDWDHTTLLNKDIKRLVLDGEICVMRERSNSLGAKRPDNGTGVGSLWSDHDLEEDFTSTVSEIRRNPPYTISHPVYFIFDILRHSEFESGAGPSTFGQRVSNIRELGNCLATNMEGEKVLRPLAQREVNDMTEIDQMVSRAANEGWEGLVLRADKPYKGSRSSDIRKFKQWLDAEYTVVGVDNNRMRLAVDGAFGEHDAMANIWIEHKGVRVSIGSGFTAEQRIRYGKWPEDLIGKEVTVEYFSESASSSREGLSLRFPRVKQIWEEGKRSL